MAAGSRLHDHDSGEGLVTVEEARERVLSQVALLAPLQLPLTEAYGCVLAEDVVSTHDLPAASGSSPVELRIAGRAMIGKRPEATVGGGEAVQIATGAPIPAGADAIVPVENAEAIGEVVRVFESPAVGAHVRPAGEDAKQGDVLVPAGTRIGPPELGLLANSGHPHPIVHPRPRVVVLSTGDELIPPTETPGFGQIRDSNAYTIFGALRDAGAIPVMAGIVHDDVEALKESVFSYLIQADAFVSSGGVSVGERDVVQAEFFRRGEIDFLDR